MLAHVNHINVGIRMDGGPFEAQAEATISYDAANEVFTIEILDLKNPEFQARAMFNQEDLDAAKNKAK